MRVLMYLTAALVFLFGAVRIVVPRLGLSVIPYEYLSFADQVVGILAWTMAFLGLGGIYGIVMRAYPQRISGPMDRETETHIEPMIPVAGEKDMFLVLPEEQEKK